MSKPFLIFFIVIELFLAVAFGMGTCLLRLDQVKAFHAMTESPSEITTAEWKRQQNITFWYNTGFSAIIFCILAAPTFLIYYKVKANRKLTKQNV